MTLGEKIIVLRKEQGLTQYDLAEKLYVSRNAISKWETNNGYPNIDNIIAISKIFCVTLDELIGEENLRTLEKKNYQKYLLFGFINLLVFLILNGILNELTPKNLSILISTIIISLRFSLIIIHFFYIEVVILRRKFLSSRQKKLTLRIDIFMILIILVVIITSVVMIFLSMQN